MPENQKTTNADQAHPASAADASRLKIFFERLGLSDLDRMTIDDLLRHAPDSHDIGLAALMGLSFAALSEGSLCLSLERSDLERTLGKAGDVDLEKRIMDVVPRLENGDYDRLVDRAGQGAFKPLVVDQGNGRRLLYFQKFYYHEQRLKKRLDLLLQPRIQHPAITDEAIQGIIEALYSPPRVIRKGKRGDPISRDAHQLDAIRAALTTSLLVISGGPGTGKTSLLVNILRALVQAGIDPAGIMLAAPTGRAAQRMSEALHANLASIEDLEPGERRLFELSGVTLHKLLVYQIRTGGFVHNARRPLPARVIVVDEVSMVDVVMMDHFFQAVDPERTKVILIGDKDQLPSVEAGSVLADISAAKNASMTDRLVVLHKVYRSSGQLLELASTINAGDPVDLRPARFEEALDQPAGQWAFVPAMDEDQLNRYVDRWTRHHYGAPPAEGLHSYVDRVKAIDSLAISSRERKRAIRQLILFSQRGRILTVVRNGPGGMQRINNRIASGLKVLLDPNAALQGRLFDGALIMITRNDYARGLFNGDVGVILRLPEGGYQAHFIRGDETMAFPASGLADWEYAFAMTVHTSQGSEFDDTWLVLPDDSEHRLLTREILYTAATRAAKRLIVYGSEAAFKTASQRKILRQSGF